MILLVHSLRDPAGVNIAKQIHQTHPFTKTSQTCQGNPVYQTEINGKNVTALTLSEESVYAQTLPEDFPDAQLIVFISRHSSQSGTPTLSVHVPGNFGTAELGGLPRRVSIAPANAMANALKALNRLKTQKGLAYEVSFEVTHHGPSLNVPTMFVELGSCERQWGDLAAAQVVGEAALEAIANFGVSKRTAVLGIGGTHYNQKFTRMALADVAVFSHMIPKYAVPQIDAEMLKQCVERSLEGVESVVLDWKGIKSEDKPRLALAVQELGLPTQKI
jgi:D-aminoacyl-tRNA deacylase